MRRFGRILVVVTALALQAAPAPAEAQWTRQRASETMAEDDAVPTVGAIDERRAIAFGVVSSGMGSSSPYFFRTSNGGESWVQGPVGDPSNPLGFELWLDFEFSGETGYGVKFALTGVKVAKSIDGGQQWADQNIAGLPEGGLKQLFEMDADHVWGVAAGVVARTTNGLAWEVVPVPGAPAEVDLTGVGFLDASHGWAVGGAFEEITEQDPMSGEEVVTDRVVLPKGTVARTTDGGATWEALRTGDAAVYTGVAFTTPTRGVLIGWDNAGPFVLATSDGGTTWDTVDLPPGPEGRDYFTFSKVRCPDALHCWVVGGAGSDGGGFMNRPVFLFSSNGGLTWALQQVDVGMGTVIDVDFVDVHRGWASGNFGQIWQFDDGAPVTPGGDAGPGADAGPTGDGGGTPQGPWGAEFGAFVDGRVPPAGSGGGGGGGGGGSASDAGATDGQGGGQGGGMALGDGSGGGGSGGTGDDCGGGGGCSASVGGGVTFPSVFALLALAFGFAVRRRAPRATGRALTAVLVPGLALAALAAGCGGSGGTCGTGSGGADGAVVGYDAVVPTDLTTPAPPTPDQGPYCVNRLDAPVAVVPGNAPGATTRTNFGDPRVVVARAAAGGGSDLWLYEPAGDTWTQLTFFDDPAVEVWDPAWSPDRGQISFVSDFSADRSPLESNLFVVQLDGTGCRQVTAGANAGHLAAEGAPTGTVQGFLRRPIGQHGVVEPVDGARVVATTGGGAKMTDGNGGFRLEVPAGDGMLVFRKVSDEGVHEAVVGFSVAAGETTDLGEIITDAVGATVRLGAPTWRPDGSGLLFRAETTLFTASGERQRTAIQAIDVDGEAHEDLVVSDAAPLGSPAFDPHRDEVLLGIGGLGLVFAPGSDPATPRLAVPLDAWQLEARPALSSHRFLAAAVPAGAGAREVLLVGADAQGELHTVTLTSFGDEGLRWDGVDWAPNGQQLALVRGTGAGGADLWIADALTGETRAATSDGGVRGVAWFGR